MGSQAWCYSSLSRHVIQVCGMLHQSGSTFRHGALFLILHFQMVSTRCKRNGKSTVVLHFAFQTHHPGLRNVAPIWIHIPTWCTFSHPTFANGDSYMLNLVTWYWSIDKQKCILFKKGGGKENLLPYKIPTFFTVWIFRCLHCLVNILAISNSNIKFLYIFQQPTE